MKLTNLVVCDVKNGMMKSWPQYLMALILFFIYSATLFYTKTPGVDYFSDVAAKFTFGDYLANIFWGMSEYVYDPMNPFNYPALWMLTILLVAYITLSYPYKDLMGVGKHLIIVSGNRYLWWLSKCIWVILSVLAYFLTAAIAILIWILLTGGEFSFDISSKLPPLLDADEYLLLPPPWDIRPFLLSIALVVVALCLIQLLISLILKPIISYVITVTILLFSAYFQNAFLLGNFIMGARSTVFLSFGLDPYQGILIGLCLCLSVMIFGGLIFKRMDILNKEKLL